MTIEIFELYFATVVCWSLTLFLIFMMMSSDPEVRADFAPGILYAPIFGVFTILFSGLVVHKLFHAPLYVGCVISAVILVAIPVGYSWYRRSKKTD